MAPKILITIFHKGQYVLNHPTQSSGDPDTLGLELLLFLFKTGNITRLKSGLENTDMPSSLQETTHPTPRTTISPTTSAEIIELISKSEYTSSLPIQSHLDGVDKWVYVIDLDAERFEIFEGRDEHAVIKTKADLEREKVVEARFLKGWELGALPNTRNRFLLPILENINKRARDRWGI